MRLKNGGLMLLYISKKAYSIMLLLTSLSIGKIPLLIVNIVILFENF